MKRVILGTAGHIDHGKTELVKALTGIDTDRLKEEKKRGISIELGFAYLDVGEDLRIGIVDVPGHEKFVRQMVAGSGSVDLAALVVALDEGVMPQTTEHLDILSLLGIKSGLVVLTKSDLVDEELALLAEEDAKDVVTGTFLEDAPMIRVSSRTGEGLDELRRTLGNLAQRVADRPVHGLLRLPVDRVFTLKGHGTVVTGTLISGTLSVGDDVEILPSGRKSSVRSIESHNRAEQTAVPGERVAINLRGVDHSEVGRGEVVTHPHDFQPSFIVDVRLAALKRAPFPLRNRMKVRFHHYTSEAEARLVFPDREELQPGEETVAQVRTSTPVVPSTGDRFVIRALSPSLTLGGGTILNPRAVKLKARSAKTFLEVDRTGDEGIVASLVRSSGPVGTTRNELLGLSGFSAKRLDKVLEHLRNDHTLVRFDPTENRMVHSEAVDLIKNRMRQRIQAFHAGQPLRAGMSKQELRSTVPGGDKLFRKVLDTLVSDGELAVDGDSVRSASHQVRLKEDEQELKDNLLKRIVSGRNAPPTFKEIVAASGSDQKQVRSLLSLLEKEGKIVRVKEDLYFSAGFMEEVKRKMVEFFDSEGGITPSRFAEITESSRKYNIPLLEYFDRERFTMRVGDQRVLRGSGSSGAGGSLE